MLLCCCSYERAREYFMRVLSLCGDRLLCTWETTLFNLGHTCRKLRMYDEAITYYSKAQNAQPKNASVRHMPATQRTRNASARASKLIADSHSDSTHCPTNNAVA
jgi:tetratricopeptide (TPR) repeat protein